MKPMAGEKMERETISSMQSSPERLASVER
jgi:hypothetical protein